MSDETTFSDQPADRLARAFRQLSPDDQDLVLALVSRLLSGGPAESVEFERDVSFMDFDGPE